MTRGLYIPETVIMNNGHEWDLEDHYRSTVQHLREVVGPYEICKLFLFSDDALRQVLQLRRVEKIGEVQRRLAARPTWPETGDRVPLSDKGTWEFLGVHLSYQTLKVQLATHRIADDVLDKMYDFLTGDEVRYKKEVEA